MTNPMSLSAMTGLPPHGPKKPKTGSKGRRPKKPGGNHLAQLTQAHGAGNFAQAKTHALNYAKSVHQHMLAASQPSDQDGDEMPMATDDPSVPPSPAPIAPPAPKSTAGVSSLAALMRQRR